MQKAKRYNKGKNRLGLIPQFAKQCLGEVYTKGAHKYSVYKDSEGNEVQGKDIPIENIHLYELIEDAGDNWRKGQNWRSALDSVYRHLSAFEGGEDYDPELNTLHVSNAAWGLFQIAEYYKIYPQGDDRQHSYLKTLRIGLDIDDTINLFVSHWCEHHKCDVPNHWEFDRDINSKLNALNKDFWLSIPTKINSKDLPFTPTCYITARSVDEEWTKEWLDLNNFPQVPIYSVGLGKSKLDIAKELNLDYFIDDNYQTFVDLNKNGVCTFLMDAPHNRIFNVGYKRIMDFDDFKKRFL